MEKTCCELDLKAKLVKHASPTLAGIKPANMFVCHNCSCNDRGCGCTKMDGTSFEESFLKGLSECRNILTPYGVRIEVLAERKTGPLLYVYRPRALSLSLMEPRVRTYLETEGYDCSNLKQCIERLHARICGTDLASQLIGTCSFPHEIGLFLGYPFDDVMGFITNKGENYLSQGCWKVYSNQHDAEECFCNYKSCTARYQALYHKGVPIERLANQEQTRELLAG